MPLQSLPESRAQQKPLAIIIRFKFRHSRFQGWQRKWMCWPKLLSRLICQGMSSISFYLILVTGKRSVIKHELDFDRNGIHKWKECGTFPFSWYLYKSMPWASFYPIGLQKWSCTKVSLLVLFPQNGGRGMGYAGIYALWFPSSVTCNLIQYRFTWSQSHLPPQWLTPCEYRVVAFVQINSSHYFWIYIYFKYIFQFQSQN